jgi:Predicted transcriptional regulator
MDLKQVLRSECRCKILEVLSATDGINIMNLVQKVNSTYNRVNPQLQILESMGIITEQRFGHIRRIKLEREKEETILLLKVLNLLNNPYVIIKEAQINAVHKQNASLSNRKQ